MMGAMNLALQPDIYCIIFQSLEVLSRIDTCLFHDMDAQPPNYSYWDRRSIYIRRCSEKKQVESDLRVTQLAIR